LRDEFSHEVWNVFLTFGREGFLITSAAAEGDDDNLSLRHCYCGASPRRSEQRAAQAKSGSGSEEVTSSAG
jgi:hypothetical protein